IGRVRVQDAINIRSGFEYFRMDEYFAVAFCRAGDDLPVKIDGQYVGFRDFIESDAMRLHQKERSVVGTTKRYVPPREVVLSFCDQNLTGPDELFNDLCTRHCQDIPP